MITAIEPKPTVSEADLSAIREAVSRSLIAYDLEVTDCAGLPMVYVTADNDANSVTFLMANDGGHWGAVDFYGTELATGPTIAAIMASEGSRIVV